jgi:murein DD-endopeptidase MepM/ murein hydrolase activator NlpD
MHLLLALLLVAGGGVTTPSERWLWPVDEPRAIVRPYVAPATPWGSGHRGIDIEAASTLVYAPADGVIHFAGLVVDRPVLSISHAGGVLSSFEPVTTTLAAGDVVRRGDVIGTLEPGHCRVVLCLHLGARIGGEYVSPLLFLGGVPRSVLLPTRLTRRPRDASPRCWPRRGCGPP